jgi:hypothetical protein
MIVQIGMLLAAASMFILGAWLARQSRHNDAYRLSFLIVWAAILGGFVGYTLLNYLSTLNIIQNDPALAVELGLDESAGTRGAISTAIAVLSSIGLWLFVYLPQLRSGLRWLFPAPQPDTNTAWNDNPDKRPWQLDVRGFNIADPVHAYAFALAILFFVQTLTDFILAGGQTGLVAAGELTQEQIVVSTILTAIMLLSVSFAGVGFLQDRSGISALHRLGLRMPTVSEATMGIGAAIAMIAFQFCAGAIWMFLTPEGVFEQQTQLSQAIAGSVTSFGGALLIALFSSVGEEIAFRGALQPVIGLWPTTLLFALTHIQYQLTPATLIIFVVGLLFGLVRKYYGTAAAIIAHFGYNFALLTLAVLASRILEAQGL